MFDHDRAHPALPGIGEGLALGGIRLRRQGLLQQTRQRGRPAHRLWSVRQFDRRICYEDLGTGGAVMVLGADRDLLSIVHNHMEFFANETCGFCVPCRAGNTLLLKSLEKIMVGNGTTADLRSIEELGRMVKTGSRCGLGQTSPNPLLTTMEHFRGLYLQKVRADVDYVSQFNLDYATAESIRVAGRSPNLEKA